MTQAFTRIQQQVTISTNSPLLDTFDKTRSLAKDALLISPFLIWQAITKKKQKTVRKIIIKDFVNRRNAARPAELKLSKDTRNLRVIMKLAARAITIPAALIIGVAAPYAAITAAIAILPPESLLNAPIALMACAFWTSCIRSIYKNNKLACMPQGLHSSYTDINKAPHTSFKCDQDNFYLQARKLKNTSQFKKQRVMRAIKEGVKIGWRNNAIRDSFKKRPESKITRLIMPDTQHNNG